MGERCSRRRRRPGGRWLSQTKQTTKRLTNIRTGIYYIYVEENKKRREIYEENKKVAMNQAFQEELEARDIILKTQEGK